MRVAILADIHGNLPACEAVLEDIAGDGARLHRGGRRPGAARRAPARDGGAALRPLRRVAHGQHRLLPRRQLPGRRLPRARPLEDGAAALDARPARRDAAAEAGRDALLGALHAAQGAGPVHLPREPDEPRGVAGPDAGRDAVRRYFMHLDAAACAFGHLHFPYRRRVGRMLIADVASAGIPRDGDLRPAYGVFTFTPKGWRVQIRRVRYPVRKATQALTARSVPGGPLLIHKLVEARYRHHHALLEAARRHSGLPPPGPVLRPPPGAPARPVPRRAARGGGAARTSRRGRGGRPAPGSGGSHRSRSRAGHGAGRGARAGFAAGLRERSGRLTHRRGLPPCAARD